MQVWGDTSRIYALGGYFIYFIWQGWKFVENLTSSKL